MKGFFITFEGGEGVGKSTQVKKLYEALRQEGHSVVQTREPGGSPEAEAIRNLVLTPELTEWDDTSELLLFSAARHQHLKSTIIPALEAKKIVLCDRFIDSTRVYQGYVGGLNSQLIESMIDLTVGNCKPQLTFILDIDPQISLQRAMQRGDVSRYENQSMDYHQKVRESFLKLASQNPKCFYVIDVAQNQDMVFKAILTVVKDVLKNA
jgi:dTMP kinase